MSTYTLNLPGGTTARQIRADRVAVGDFLLGISNGYVIDVEHNPDLRNEYNTRLGGEDFWCITFNDEDGDEDYLLVFGSVGVLVARESWEEYDEDHDED